MSLDLEEKDSQNDVKEDPEPNELRDDGIQIEGIESSGDLSYKWVEQIENIKTVEKGIKFQQFYTNYALRMVWICFRFDALFLLLTILSYKISFQNAMKPLFISKY